MAAGANLFRSGGKGLGIGKFPFPVPLFLRLMQDAVRVATSTFLPGDSLMNWEKIADKTCAVICTCLKQRSILEIAARKRKTTFESLMAAAIVQMIREELDAE